MGGEGPLSAGSGHKSRRKPLANWLSTLEGNHLFPSLIEHPSSKYKSFLSPKMAHPPESSNDVLLTDSKTGTIAVVKKPTKPKPASK